MDPMNAVIWLIATPLLSVPVVYLAGRLVARKAGDSSTINPARWVALAAMLVTGVFLFVAGQSVATTSNPIGMTVETITLRFDGISLVLAFSVWLLGTLVILFSGPYMTAEVGEEKFYSLLMAMIGTMIGLGTAVDLFNLWVWFEAMAISSYMLVAFYREEPASLEAGVKYLVQSAVGSVLILMGIVVVFMYTGTLNPDVFRMYLMPWPGLIGAGALFIIGFGVKTALVPLHTWLPDAHSQAPSGISAMLSGVVIETGLIAMLRSLGALSEVYNWGIILVIFAAVNMLVGNLMALRQKQVKRLLAYSSVAHMGYMLFGLGVALSFGQSNGAAGGFFHLFNHAMMKGLAFLGVGALLYALHLARGDHSPLMVEDLNGAARKYPWVVLTLSIGLLALGGLPPLAGFMSKWQILVAGAQTQNVWMIVLVVFMGLNSVLSLGYYAPLVNRMYRTQPSDIVMEGKPVSWLMTLPLILLAFGTVVLGFYPALLNWLTKPAALALFQTFGR